MEEKGKFPETVLDKKNNIEYKLCGLIGSVNILLLLRISVNCLGVCGLYRSIPITSYTFVQIAKLAKSYLYIC